MKTVMKYYRQYIPLILCIVVLLFGQAMCELSLPGYMSDIINNGIVKTDMDYIHRTGRIMILIAAGSAIFSIAGNAFGAKVGANIARDLRSSLFRRVTDFSTADLDRFSTASLITRSTNDVQNLQQTTVMGLRFLIFAPCMGIGALIKAFRTSPGLTWTIVIGLIATLFIMLIIFIVVMPKFKVLQSKLDKLNLVVKERLEGLLVIRAFNTERFEEERYDDANRDLTKINIFVNRAMAVLFPGMTLIMNLTCVLIVWKGAHLVGGEPMMIGNILAFLQYAMQVIMSFLFITMMFIMLPRAAVSGNRIGEVLDREPSVEDPDRPVLPHQCSSPGVVEFSNVSFSYPGSSENTLEDISFTAEPGRTTAVIGSTGSGKSTLISLIPRFYDVTSGSVKIDGLDVRDMTQNDLRKKIGLVPQKGLLFSGTVASNLRYGKEGATEEEMRSACETAQAMEFIKDMPFGFDTEVSQGGTSVSGGQKQRLSIARALIKKPDIYIFDDSFSALDFKTDAALRKALRENVGESTFIIVAQRINTIMDADNII
ncbi:MAG: ABC transporter ATP-binding protein, partial [Anaerovoracaceae bacterium]|nr:ABC transporter ATP-binding protein [Anaerovoracaceae bacterium]